MWTIVWIGLEDRTVTVIDDRIPVIDRISGDFKAIIDAIWWLNLTKIPYVSF